MRSITKLMNTYYIQYVITNIEKIYIEEYFKTLEKNLRKIVAVDVKHSFMQSSKIYINVYAKGRDAAFISKQNLNLIKSIAVDSLNYVPEDDLHLEIVKVESV